MLKTTALASTVTLAEITGIAETIAAQTFAPYEVFLSAAVIYLVLAWSAERILKLFETEHYGAPRPKRQSSLSSMFLFLATRWRRNR